MSKSKLMIVFKDSLAGTPEKLRYRVYINSVQIGEGEVGKIEILLLIKLHGMKIGWLLMRKELLYLNNSLRKASLYLNSLRINSLMIMLKLR